MVQLVYFTDLHHGKDLESAHDPAGATRGSQAHSILNTILNYADLNGGLPIIHGGDENSIACDQDIYASNVASTDRILSGYAGHMIRAAGNHDPFRETKWAESTIPPHSFAAQIDDHVTAIVLQPKIYEAPTLAGQMIYHYNGADEALVENILSERPNDAIVLVSHWGLDRLERGYPGLYDKNPRYGYEVKTHSIRAMLAERPAGSVINLSGHEHRHSFNKTSAVPTLIMPAVTQYDIDHPEQACGLFSVLNITKRDTGEIAISIDYKRALLNGTVEDETELYMGRYYRTVKPMAAVA